LRRLTSTTSKQWPSKSTPAEIVAHIQSINGKERKHFHPGFKVRDIPEDCRCSEKPATEAEVLSCQTGLKRGKAPGCDAAVAEFLAMPELTPLLTRLINGYIIDGNEIEEVLHTLVALVPKKGDLTIVDNFRPVCLISHFLKLINLLLLKRLRDSADKFLRYGQNGFRPHRGTMTHAMALRMMADVGDPMYLLFVDFSSAFPSVTFASIESALRSFQVPQRIIDAVMRCHHGHKVRIKGEDGIPLSECYEMLTGVMQGDTLAPYLFIMVLDCLLCELEEEKLLTGFPLSQRTVTHEGPRRTTRSASAVNTSVVHELGFADDLLFPCAKFEDMEPLLRALRDKAKSIGLDINLKKGKTEYILVNVDKEKFAGKNVTCPDANGTMVTIHCAEDYTYLGVRSKSSAPSGDPRPPMKYVLHCLCVSSSPCSLMAWNSSTHPSLSSLTKCMGECSSMYLVEVSTVQPLSATIMGVCHISHPSSSSDASSWLT
jgi:hypothetical protein